MEVDRWVNSYTYYPQFFEIVECGCLAHPWFIYNYIKSTRGLTATPLRIVFF